MITNNKKSVKPSHLFHRCGGDPPTNNLVGGVRSFSRNSAFSQREFASTQCALIHYHEIALKGKNRAFFENKLKENIGKTLKDIGEFRVKRLSGRILIGYTDGHGYKRIDTDISRHSEPRCSYRGELREESRDPSSRQGGAQDDTREYEQIKKRLEKVFGIAYFCFAYTHRFTQIRTSVPEQSLVRGKAQINADVFIENLSKDIFDLIKNKKFKSFKIDAKRADKNFPMTSQEINEKVGGCILKTLTDTDIKRTDTDTGTDILDYSRNAAYVDLENPDLIIFIEILPKEAFIYTEKIKGPGGLPVGTAGKVVSLISSGIDSPVASWNIMKRGARVVFVHFHSYPRTSRASVENTEKLVKILNQYQFESKLYLIPFLDIQKEIFSKAPEKLRVILYRRAMFRIAEEIAKKEGARALVTGESLGQVASQTIENIGVISEAIKIPVFRPLIGQDKEEIIQLARKIGTYEISIRPYEDCCSLFTPKHPETKARIEEIKNIEKNLALERLIKKALKGRELRIIKIDGV